jgi:hypothetical protein
MARTMTEAQEKQARFMLVGGLNCDRLLAELDAERRVSKALASALANCEVELRERVHRPISVRKAQDALALYKESKG